MSLADEKGRTPGKRQRFRPRNTLASPRKPVFDVQLQAHDHQLQRQVRRILSADLEQPTNAPPDAHRTMVRERSPERTSSALSLSPQQPVRKALANISAKMQSGSPKQTPDDEGKPAHKTLAHPEFGKASPLRNPLQRKPPPNVFMPRQKPAHRYSPQESSQSSQASQSSPQGATSPTASRKTFYLPGQKPQPQPSPTYSSALEAAQAFTSQPAKRLYNSDVFEIPQPTNAVLPPVQARPKPTFSSLGPNTFYEPYVARKPVVDLTKDTDDEEHGFDPDAALREENRKFGEPDPFMYVDSSQANENIKNLLEGAFDDEEDKSNTRLRRRAKRAPEAGDEKKSKSLANRLEALSVQGKDDGKAATPPTTEEEEDEEDGTVEGLKVMLLPHQVEGVAWMIDKEIGKGKVKGSLPYGGILADDMGLGKTVQSMTLILTNPRPGPDAKPEHKLHKLPGKEVGKGTLVVAPLALIKQWEDEIRTKVAKSHALRVLVHHGPSRTKSAVELKKYDVVITTYQTLTSEHAGSNMTTAGGARIGCFGVHWYRMILDEAHSIKNRNAKSTLAACAIPSWYRWCLTGTPMQNNLDELQSLIKFLQIKPYNNLQNWREGIIQPMKNGRGGLAMKRLQYFLRAIMKRRTKDILKKEGALNFGGKAATEPIDGDADSTQPRREGMQIVKREVVTVECDFDQQELDFYQRLQSRADRRLEEIKNQKKKDYIGALVLLLRLRQACNHPQLIEMAMNKDKDAMTTGMNPGSGSKQSQTEDGDMDALTALMGGVSVETKNCDVCQIKLSRKEIERDCVRCDECEADLATIKRSTQKKSKSAHRDGPTQARARARRVIDDSDEDEGEWIAGGPERRIDLGKAGGSEDEDAEGGGETLGSIDSDRSADGDEDEEDSSPRARIRQAGVKSELGGDDGNEDDSDDNVDESDSEASILDGLQPSGKAHGKPSTKIRRLLRILHAEVAEHKTIVFSQFTSMLDLIEPHLRSSRLIFARYDGSMRPDAREESLHSLRTNPKCRILLCSLKCGSLGLNLTAASRVVILEPFWNPFVEEQAIDRVHRLNQTVDVKVYRLTIRNTVEAEILNLQQRKRELAAAAIEGGSKAGVGKLSMEDILSLFRHDAVHSGQHLPEDKEMWAKFGSDRRLLEGSSTGHEQSGETMQRDPRLKKPGKEKLFKEHDVFGRRWN